MPLIVYPDGHNPSAQEYKFYGGTETLRFDKSKWLYSRVMPDGSLQPQSGVTNIVHIIDKSAPLMAWAVKKALEKLKRLLLERAEKSHMFDGNTVSEFDLILDEIIIKAKKSDREELEAAAETGSLAHNWIEQYIKSIIHDDDDRRLELLAKLPLDERAANACIAACVWMDVHNVRWISTERKCFSRKYGYAGTMDGLARVDSCSNPVCCPHAFKDRLTLADWKTSNYLYIEYLLQTAAYQQAHQEETGEQIEDRWIIRLGKEDAEFDPWHVEGAELFTQDFDGFLCCLALSKAIDAIDTRIDGVKEVKREYKRKIARELKDAANLIACPVSDEYKGKRKKKGCNGTEVLCVKCHLTYQEAQCKK